MKATDGALGSPFSVAFGFGCDLIKTESEIAKVNWRTPGKRLWTESSTSLLLGVALTAAESRAMQPGGGILFSFVK
jgi:hypothetical protein